MMKGDFVVLDIETTGLHPYKHGITEIAAVHFDGEHIVEKFHTLVHPGRHIPQGITRLTGISNEMVADAPSMADAVQLFSDFLGEKKMVGHNISFDFRFLNHYLYEYYQRRFENERICTLRLARKYLELPNRRLGTVCDHFGIVNDQAHRAMSDTMVTLHIFQKFLEMGVEI